MFEYSEEELTWQIVGQWTTSDTDFDYSISTLYQPMTRMDTMTGSSYHASGKPYKVHIMYFLKGYQLFIASLPHGEDESKDFQSKQLVDLTTLDIMTEPAIRIKPRHPLSLFSSDRMEVCGEKFFSRSNTPDLRPYSHSFTLRYPESGYKYQWEDAQRFSSMIKQRIYKYQQEGERTA
jgi:hypothetical protein